MSVYVWFPMAMNSKRFSVSVVRAHFLCSGDQSYMPEALLLQPPYIKKTQEVYFTEGSGK